MLILYQYAIAELDQRGKASYLHSKYNFIKTKPNSSPQQMEDRSNQQLLTMNVDIGDGRTDTIRISQQDDPTQLAQAFTSKYSLSSQMCENLAMLIRENKEMMEARTNTLSGLHFQTEPNMSPTLSKPPRPAHTKSGVFERLYKQARLKPRPQNSRGKSSSNLNYGQWLYTKGQSFKEKSLKKLSSIDRGDKECTFRPQIDEFSRLISPRCFEKTEQSLMRRSQEYKERLRSRQALKSSEQMKECSFTPKIIKKQVSLGSGTRKNEQLYEQAASRRLRRTKINQVVTKLNYTSDEKLEEIADRLINTKTLFESKMEKMRNERDAKELLDGGRPLFSPMVGRRQNVRSENDIFEHLYSKRNDKSNKADSKQSEIQEKWSIARVASKVSENSKLLVQNFRGKQYSKIFSIMDSDGDGLISADEVCVQALDSDLLDVLCPIFKMMDQGQEFDISRFALTMQSIWGKLTPDQKGFIMKRGDRNEVGSQQEIQLVSQTSVKLAQKRREDADPDFYNRQVNAEYLKELKAKKTQELLQEQEMKECSFRPKILRKKQVAQESV